MALSIPGLASAARVAEPDEAISIDELALAARNHALPLEAMRYQTSPPGLHYVLSHYDIPFVDPAGWRLRLGGSVERTLVLSLDDLREMPQHTVRVTIECAGNGRAALEPRPVSQPWISGAVGTADWGGVPLAQLLDDARVDRHGVEVVFTGSDHGLERGVEQDYQRSMSLADAREADVLVATEMNGSPLPPQHGFPARLVVPGWYGMAHVKWLREITVVDRHHENFQNDVAYRLRQTAGEVGDPVTRIEPRALLVPPGFPDFMTRTRVARPGQIELEGRAWSGWGAISRVEVSTDDGGSWQDAVLGGSSGRWAWRGFTLSWPAGPGDHILRVRAHDETGRVQPLDPAWNRGGFANNADQPLRVVVLDE